MDEASTIPPSSTIMKNGDVDDSSLPSDATMFYEMKGISRIRPHVVGKEDDSASFVHTPSRFPVEPNGSNQDSIILQSPLRSQPEPPRSHSVCHKESLTGNLQSSLPSCSPISGPTSYSRNQLGSRSKGQAFNPLGRPERLSTPTTPDKATVEVYEGELSPICNRSRPMSSRKKVPLLSKQSLVVVIPRTGVVSKFKTDRNGGGACRSGHVLPLTPLTASRSENRDSPQHQPPPSRGPGEIRFPGEPMHMYDVMANHLQLAGKCFL
jgi:hypothetical protein